MSSERDQLPDAKSMDIRYALGLDMHASKDAIRNKIKISMHDITRYTSQHDALTYKGIEICKIRECLESFSIDLEKNDEVPIRFEVS